MATPTVNPHISALSARWLRIWSCLQRGVAHAFALRRQESRLKAEEFALLDRFARLLADRGLATPAIFLVESLIPLGFLASQLVHAMTPIMGMVAPPDDIERLARLLEREETPALFIDRLRREEEDMGREVRGAQCEVRGAEDEGGCRES